MAKKKAEKKKLTEDQYFALQQQWENTPELYGTSASGEHYQLMHLLNRFGYRPRSVQEAMKLAEELLADGWE